MSASGQEPTTADSAPPTLVGREQEVRQIDRLIERIGTHGGALVLRGDAGIGKSALLRVAADRALEQGATVVATTGTQTEFPFAFGGLHQVLVPFLNRLPQLPPPQRKALEVAFGIAEGEAPDLFMVALATLGLLTESAEATPLLLVVDDAHWLDRSSAEVLTFVARRLDMEVVVMLLAVRDGVPSDLDGVDLPELRLAGLDDGASRALLQETGADFTEEVRERILRDAGGNPLALLELPIAIRGVEPTLPWQPLPLTARLEAAFTARLKDLPRDVRTLLLLAALDDRDVTQLSRAAEGLLGSRIYLTDWSRAAATGLGSLEGETFQYRHPLMRSAVRQAATDNQRCQAHAVLARTLAGDPDRDVWHRAAAADGPDDEVADALVATADRAESRGGHDIAFAALQRAAELAIAPPQRALLLQRAGEIAMLQGRPSDSVALLREALQLGLPPQDAVRTTFNLETMTNVWTGSSAIPRFAEIAKEIATGGDDSTALDRLVLVGMRAHWGPLDDTTRRDVSTIVAGLDVPADDPQRLAALALIDPFQHAREVIERVSAISPVSIADPDDLMQLGTATSAVWADNLALPFLRAAVAGFRADGRLQLLGQSLVLEAWSDVRRGAARMAITSASEGASIAGETGALRYVLVANLAQAIAAAGLGDEEGAERLIAEAEASLLPMGANPLLSLVAFARGRSALAAERPAEAYGDLMRIFKPTDVASQPFVRGWALADLAEAAVHGDGELEAVRDILHEWGTIAFDTQAPHLAVQLSYARALLTDDATTPELFELSISSAADGWPGYVARAQLAYGQWLRRQRRDADSRVHLREAAQAFEALGQKRYAQRALRELRASGERARRRAPETWTELSPQELQIAQLAAEGLSNRQIGERLYLSHRTIGTHLYNIFPKLGITSRAQLRDVLGGPHAL